MAGGPLRGRSVVITRPAEQAVELAALLEARGAHVRSRPLIRIEPSVTGELATALGSLSTYDWVAFTSANAVRACVEAAPRGAAWPPAVCVGPGTARTAEAAGVRVAAVAEEFTAEGLAAAWPGTLAGARVLWPRASAARPVLAELLGAAGAHVDACEAYRTVTDETAARSLHEELRTAPADVLLFTSPSAVRAFAAAGPVPAGTRVGVIGTITARAAAAAGVPVHVLPTSHTLVAMVAALETQAGGAGGDPQWFAVFTRARHEKQVDRLLAERVAETYLPLVARPSRWQDRTRIVAWPLFPSYTFARFERAELHRVLELPGVVSVVRHGEEITPIADADIANVRRFVAALHGHTERIERVPMLAAGEWVEILEGPFTGVRGQVLERPSRRRVLVGLPALGQGFAIGVEAVRLRPCREDGE